MGRCSKLTKERIEKMWAEGRGQGEGAEYRPWIEVGDFPSAGRAHRISDIHNGRIHHFLSDMEARYYYILLWRPDVIDIREQFPLETERTEAIAQKLGYRHPKCHDGSSYVMTTDFLGTHCDPNNGETQLFARSVKQESELTNRRTLQKLQIEYQYWTDRCIDWKCVTEHSFTRQKAMNTRKIMERYYFSLGEQTEVLCQTLEKRILEQNDHSLSETCDWMDNAYGLRPGDTLALFFHLVAHREIEIDIKLKILPKQQIQDWVDCKKLSIMTLNKAVEKNAAGSE